MPARRNKISEMKYKIPTYIRKKVEKGKKASREAKTGTSE